MYYAQSISTYVLHNMRAVYGCPVLTHAQDKARQSLWLLKIKRDNLVVKESSSVLCSVHFEEDQFVTGPTLQLQPINHLEFIRLMNSKYTPTSDIEEFYLRIKIIGNMVQCSISNYVSPDRGDIICCTYPQIVGSVITVTSNYQYV